MLFMLFSASRGSLNTSSFLFRLVKVFCFYSRGGGITNRRTCYSS
eukprot:XP_001706086.1 Hypothetical protein GL50803_36046 [Giardia lamblia ATCC 50803]